MKKILYGAMLVSSVFAVDNNITITDNNLVIKGNGEKCKVTLTSKGKIESTTCTELNNSKNVKILCTTHKKMCKTEKEVFNAWNEDQLTKKLIPIMARDLSDERLINQQAQAIDTTSTCVEPPKLDNIDASKLSIRQQRDILWKYTDQWKSYEACMTNKIKAQPNVEAFYNAVKEGTDCNPGFAYVFNEWNTDVVSMRTSYVVNTECTITDVNRKLFFLDKIFSAKINPTQAKWEEYVQLSCDVKDIHNYESELTDRALHTAEKDDIMYCIQSLITNRVEEAYRNECESYNSRRDCKERTFM